LRLGGKESFELTVGVPTEAREGEKRVALTPDGVKILREKGFEVAAQAGCGEAAGFGDAAYQAAGATIVPDAGSLLHSSDLVVQVNGPADGDLGLAERIRPGTALVSFLYPLTNLETVRRLQERQLTTFAMELIPRITRAQSMDALSSMSTIAGYRGALLAATHLPKFFPMFMTAAGTIPPAKVFVIGAGVAGLQAIATCKRLGAIVEAFDVRPAVKEQVESLGARFVALSHRMDDAEDASGYAKEVSGDTHLAELELIGSRVAKADAVITTALVPGRPAPVLITREMVRSMPAGSVVVDLAAPAGGNCEATVPRETVLVDGVTIVGSTSLLSDMASDASRMYSKNVTEFLGLIAPGGTMALDLEDPIQRETLVTHQGRVHHEPTRMALEKGGPA
jgi:H+-translocating NAD(P) transhydrogenase subunit alpha